MRTSAHVLGALLALALAAGPVAAQERVRALELPDLALHRTTGEPLAHKRLTGDGPWLEIPAPVDRRHLLRASLALGGELRPHELRAGRATLSARLGWRPAADRLLQVRSDLDATRTGGGSQLDGRHRLRARYGLGDAARRIVPELDIAAEHGDVARLLVGTGAASGRVRDVEAAARVTVVDRGSWLGDVGVRVPVEARAHVRAVDGSDRAGQPIGGGVTATTVGVRSGLGIDFGSRYQPDGWWELLGVSLSRTEIERPTTTALRGRAASDDTQLLDRVDVRVASLDEVVLVDDFGEIAVHSVRAGHSWLRDPRTGRAATLFTGGIGTLTRFWDHGVLGAAVGRDARLTADGRDVVESWRLEAHAELQTEDGTGASLRYASSRIAPLSITAGPITRGWEHAVHSRWQVGFHDVAVGLEHVADRRLEASGARRWHHYLGAFASFELSARDARALR